MNKSESKYYNTALLMDKALIELLNKKEYEFVTVKEICEKAGVNRSTFYLHYENIDDLLNECLENTMNNFFSYFDNNAREFIEKIDKCSKNELYLITPKYLTPYLKYIKENKVIHQVFVKRSVLMNSQKKFNGLNHYIFKPIFKRFGINEKDQKYMILYYVNGLLGVINEWIKNNCKDDISYIENIITKCIYDKK